MCKNKILASNKNGYIARCEQCLHLQLAFGTCIFGLEPQEFSNFNTDLYALRAEADNFGPYDKKVYVKIGSENAMLLLTPCELELLIDLVESASIKNLISSIHLN